MVLSVIGRIAREHPVKFGTIFSCAKTSFSDWLVQTQIEKREHIDWRRNFTFASFGFFYLGGVQYALYVPVFSRLFPGAAAYAAAPLSAKLKDVVGTRNMIAQVVLDQFVHHPFAYFPAFYMLKEVVNGGRPEGGLAKYAKNYKEDLFALWKLWVPSTIINFSIMPMHLRIPWVASTSLIWTCIISYMRGSDDVATNADDAMDLSGGNQGKALQALYDIGVAAKPAYLYDSSKDHLLVTASGRDRIGFIQDLCRQVQANAGSVLDLKAYKVGREFVTTMLVEVDPKNKPATIKQMAGLGGKGVQVAVNESQPWLSDSDSPRCKDGVTFTGHMRCTGADRPGLLLELTELLADLKLDIVSIQCQQHCQLALGSSTQSQTIAQVQGAVRAFTPIDRAELAARIASFEADTGYRLGIEETEPDLSFSAFKTEPSSHVTKLSRKVTEFVKER